MTTEEDHEYKTNRRPADTPFKQQRLQVWQPLFNAGNVYIFVFVIGIIAIPIGISILHVSNQVNELIIDYTKCNRTIIDSSNTTIDTGIACYEHLLLNNSECSCTISFTIEKDLIGPVFMYYGLSNYFQNHRRYVKSADEYQILGILSNDLSSDCEPFGRAFDVKANKELPIAPCGAIANSLFNDTLTLYKLSNTSERILVPLIRTGIAWSFDKNINFQNPKLVNGSLEKAFEGFTKPRNWQKYVWELDIEDPANNGFQNEDLMVWMRTAGLPSFKKLYRKINHVGPDFENGLLKGNYQLIVDYAYNLADFNGTKQMILSTTSIIGTKNPFLGTAFIVAGCIWFVLGLIFLALYIKYEKRRSIICSINPRGSWSPQNTW